MKKIFPIYPVLLGLIWVLGIYSVNQLQLPGLGVTLVPLATTIGTILVLLGIARLLLRDWKKAALVTSILFVVGTSYGYVKVDNTTVLLACLGAVGFGGIVLVLKGTTPAGRQNLTVVANVVSICTLLVVVVGMVASSGVAPSSTSRVPLNTNSREGSLPDIYYIIPDKYASFKALDSYYGYDSREFLDYLESKEFFVVKEAYANYPSTRLALSSVLNMRYLEEGETSGTVELVLDYQVGHFLQELGYEYIHIGSWWEPTASNPSADVNLSYPGGEFSQLLFSMTVLEPISERTTGYDSDESLRRATLEQFEYLKKIPSRVGPTFTFVHILAPHYPFIFNADGSPTTLEQVASRTLAENKLEQTKFVSSLLQEAIDEILDNSDIPPVIILQADEGPSAEGWCSYWAENQTFEGVVEAEPEATRVRSSILFAVYLPSATQEAFKGFSSPVNTFRVVFNYLFGTGLEILPDRYYHTDSPGIPYGSLMDITDFIKKEY